MTLIKHLNRNNSDKFKACCIYKAVGKFSIDHKLNNIITNKNLLQLWKNISSNANERRQNTSNVKYWVELIQNHHRQQGKK